MNFGKWNEYVPSEKLFLVGSDTSTVKTSFTAVALLILPVKKFVLNAGCIDNPYGISTLLNIMLGKPDVLIGVLDGVLFMFTFSVEVVLTGGFVIWVDIGLLFM